MVHYYYVRSINGNGIHFPRTYDESGGVRMTMRKLEVYSKPEGMNQREWEREFLNPIAYPELKRRGLTDRQIANFFDIRFYSVIEYRRNHPQFAIRKRRLA